MLIFRHGIAAIFLFSACATPSQQHARIDRLQAELDRERVRQSQAELERARSSLERTKGFALVLTHVQKQLEFIDVAVAINTERLDAIEKHLAKEGDYRGDEARIEKLIYQLRLKSAAAEAARNDLGDLIKSFEQGAK